MTMISKETFRQIQIHKSYGVTQRETARRVGVSSETVRRWWNKTAEEFEEEIIKVGQEITEYIKNHTK